jgi:YHS domain-containing protein
MSDVVEDPVAGVRFPRFAAGATTEWNGKVYYFIGDETLRDFQAQHRIAAK